MPGAPVVCPPGRTPLLNTLPGRTAEREARSSALLLAVMGGGFCVFKKRDRPYTPVQGFPPRPGFYWKQITDGKKREQRGSVVKVEAAVTS